MLCTKARGAIGGELFVAYRGTLKQTVHLVAPPCWKSSNTLFWAITSVMLGVEMWETSWTMFGWSYLKGAKHIEGMLMGMVKGQVQFPIEIFPDGMPRGLIFIICFGWFIRVDLIKQSSCTQYSVVMLYPHQHHRHFPIYQPKYTVYLLLHLFTIEAYLWSIQSFRFPSKFKCLSVVSVTLLLLIVS